MSEEKEEKEVTYRFDRANIKVIAETSFMKPSGEHGTPMFSRVGKQTATETLEFQGESKVQCESSFA